jgi:hypothetical protein
MNESKGNPDQSDTSKSFELIEAGGTGPLLGRRAILGSVLGSSLLAGCETMFIPENPQATSTRFHWDEEVQLADGRIIIVRQGRGTSRIFDGDRTNSQPTLGSLRFTLPEIQAAPIDWQDQFMPLILNVHEGKVYVGGSPWIGRHFNEFGRPRSGWVVQRYNPVTKGWERIPASATPEPIRTTNLLINRAPAEGIKLMTIAIKNSNIYNGRTSEASILPEKRGLDPNRRSNYVDGTSDRGLTD